MEKLSRPERGIENHPKLEHLAAERLRHIEKNSERSPLDREQSVEAAREQIKTAEQTVKPHEKAPSEESAPRPILTKALNYKNTMVSLRHRLKPASRSFSKVIHQPAVEAVSEGLAKTVARPSISLGAPLGGLLVGGSLYLYARNYGYPLRGSEILLGMLIGAVLGIIAEIVSRGLRKLFARQA